MELLFSISIGVLAASGVYLLLRARTFSVMLGMMLLSYAVNLFVFATGQLRTASAPILSAAPGQPIDPLRYADPLPQALILTAIVIGFATTALFAILALRGMTETGTDHVDGGRR